MTAILRRLPFTEIADEVSVDAERLVVKPWQIIVWVSITPRSALALPTQARRIPTIVDTGHNHYFSIDESQLLQWTRIPPSQLPQRGAVTLKGSTIPLHAAAVWLHPNLPGERDRFTDQPPLRLEIPHGIAIHVRPNAPRLPLLGLRTLVRNKLHFTLDPERCTVDLRTPDWHTKLRQWCSLR
jgi:hypothetical protein